MYVVSCVAINLFVTEPQFFSKRRIGVSSFPDSLKLRNVRNQFVLFFQLSLQVLYFIFLSPPFTVDGAARLHLNMSELCLEHAVFLALLSQQAFVVVPQLSFLQAALMHELLLLRGQ